MAIETAGSEFHDLDLHILRALEWGHLGAAEGSVFEKIALDTSRRAPVRAWAWKAWGRSSRWNDKVGAEAAEAEADPHVQRAAVVPFRSKPSLRRTQFLTHLREHHPELRYTTLWAAA